MSIDYNAHVGPFIICKNEPVELENTTRSCNNENCAKYKISIWNKEIKFCPTCGSEIKEMSVMVKGMKINPHEIEGVDGRLSFVQTETEFEQFKGRDLWISNLRGIGGKCLDPRYDTYCITPPEDIEIEIEQFCEIFATEIGWLSVAYGEGNVEISWGFLGWRN